MKKGLVGAAVSLVVTGAAVMAIAPAAMATANGGMCQLTGTANFGGSGLTLTSSPFTYTFSGNLSNCHSGSTGGLNSTPTGGTIATLGTATGSGSCGTSTTAGVAAVNWNDGDTSVVQYTTSGAAAAVVQQGKVLSSYTYQSGVDSSGNPIMTTVTTNEPSTPAGDSVLGLLTFNPTAGPTACNTGVTSAAINGAIGTGSQS